MYEPRFYRKQGSRKLETFAVCYKETDLLIHAPVKMPEICFNVVRRLRLKMDEYIKENPLFLKALSPIEVSPDAIEEIKEMARCSIMAGVGPMAAVAGIFAEKTGRELLKYTDEVIVENGGDIFIKTKDDCRIGIYAGKDSPFTDRLVIKLKSSQMPLGVCSSSGMIGHSYSEGKADVVTVISRSTALADAAATAVANWVKVKEDIDDALSRAREIKGISGVLIIKDDKLGVWGDLELGKK